MARKKSKSQLSFERDLARKYYTPKLPNSFSGLTTFIKTLPRKKRTKAEQWLTQQEPFSLHRPVRKKFLRRKVTAPFERQLQTDLIDLAHIAKDNDGYRYLLTAIDVFSRKAFVEILKRKDCATVTNAFEAMLKKMGFQPKSVHSDQGSEFIGAKFRSLMRRKGINFFTSKDSTIKCGTIERFNKSLMSKLYRMFTKRNSYRFIENLPNILHSYNNTRHSSIGISPEQVNHTNKEQIWLKLYATPTKKFVKKLNSATKKSDKLKKGSYVRISKKIRQFSKGYKSRWSGEIFQIANVNRTKPPTFDLIDLKSQPIEGTFYAQEIAPTVLPKNYAIERILDSKNGKFLIKYRDYPDKFNEWVSSRAISDI